MREFSVVEEYVLMLMDNNQVKNNMYFKGEDNVNIMIGIFVELIKKKAIDVDENNNIIVVSNDNIKSEYLELQYNVIKKTKPKKIEQWIRDAVVEHGIKNKEVIDCLVKSFIKEEYIYSEKLSGIFISEKYLYKVKKETLDFLVEKMRVEILEFGDIDEETKLLILLLDLNKKLNYYFSKYESGILSKRLNEIRKCKIGRQIDKLQKSKYRPDEMVTVVIPNNKKESVIL